MKKIAMLAAISVILSSCVKKINVDLKNADARLVIEGVVNNSTAAEVLISKSVQYSSKNTFPPVSGAQVSITDNLGSSFTLTETTTGKYTSPLLIGVSGRTYKLTVLAEGKSYIAVSTMPQQVGLDTVLTEDITFIGKNIIALKPQYTDPAGFGNYYKFYQIINGKTFPSYWIWDDRLDDNGVSTRPLIQTDSTIKINDMVEVEMQCIDKNIYKYFVSLLDVQSNNTVPANPDSNISGGCLGYFSAHTSQKKKIVIK
jgi:hypothetical protein